jgi:uncharacterized protein (TIGR02145 family)
MKLTISLLAFLITVNAGYAQTVTIGEQIWHAKNLNVSTFRNGDPIPEAKTDEEWTRAGENKQPAWCYYDNDPANGTKYGKLYNWYAVNDPRGLAPAGYHIPTDLEWDALTAHLGGAKGGGKKMKSTSGWKSYSTGGYKNCSNCVSWSKEYREKMSCLICKDTRSVSAPTVTNSGNGSNSSGFSGLPSGKRGPYGYFENIGGGGYWWAATESNESIAWGRFLNYHYVDVTKSYHLKATGLTVRCIKD